MIPDLEEGTCTYSLLYIDLCMCTGICVKIILYVQYGSATK